MPYNVSGDDMLTTLKQKFALLKQHLHNLESSQSMYCFCGILSFDYQHLSLTLLV